MFTEPSATLTAPVSVAASMRCVAPSRTACVNASASTSRPSASVLITSIVLPFIACTMSPGRVAEPLGMFSTRPSRQLTRCLMPSRAIAVIAPSIVAAPAMSYFIFSIDCAGLRDRPPVSNVTPLPTRNRCESPVASLGFQARRTSRGGRAEPLATLRSEPAPSASSPASSSTSTSSPAAWPIDSAMSANSTGPRSFAGMSTRRRVRFTDSPTIRPASNAAESAPGATIKISSNGTLESSLLYLGCS